MDTHLQRRSPRLQGYDYTQGGAYFVTICTHGRVCLFGAVIDGAMVLSRAGVIAYERWLALPDHHAGVELDAFVVMPNHVHGIILLVGTGPALSGPAPQIENVTKTDNAGVVPTQPSGNVSLSTVIGSYKSGVTRRIHEQGLVTSGRVWQGRYHDHIIRSPGDLARIQEYVVYNAGRWQADVF